MRLVYIFFVCLFILGCNKFTTNKKNSDNNDFFTMPWHKFYVKYNEKGKALNLNNLYDLPAEKMKNNKVDSIDPYLSSIRKYSKSKEVFYYAVLDTTDYYSIIYKTYSDYEESYDLVNYSKDYSLLDFITISMAGGDSDFLYFTKSNFINDSIVRSEYIEGNLENIYSISGKDKITNQYELKITSCNDGKIKVDTIR